jgi:hypothetical protein
MLNIVIKPDVIELPAGAVVRLAGSWQDYQMILENWAIALLLVSGIAMEMSC